MKKDDNKSIWGRLGQLFDYSGYYIIGVMGNSRMEDKAFEIIKRGLKSKISFYINPLWIRISILVILAVFALDSVFE